MPDYAVRARARVCFVINAQSQQEADERAAEIFSEPRKISFVPRNIKDTTLPATRDVTLESFAASNITLI